MITLRRRHRWRSLSVRSSRRKRKCYDLKHDLISNQIKAESDEKARKELEEQNKELLINKAKLEASLEDALLGKVTEKDKTEE